MNYITETIANNSKKTPWHTYIALFFMMYLSSGFGISEMSGTKILLWDLLLFGYICITNLKLNIGRYGTSVLCLILALLSYLVNGEPSKQILILMSYFILSIAYCGSNEWKDTCTAYVKIMHVVCLSSIILYAIDILAPSMLNALPKVSNGNFELSTVFVAVSPKNNRNNGMFWEPGAFQTYIFLAFIIEVFHFKAENKKRLTTLIVALVTTFSTAGYITILIALIAVLMSGAADRKIKMAARNTIIIIMLGAIVAYYIINTFNPHLAYTLFGKLEVYNQTGNDDTSTGVRVNSFFDTFKIFMDNPVFGVGRTKLQGIFESKYGHEMATCTYANWFAYFGAVCGILMVSGIYKFTSYFSQKQLVRFIIFMAFMASVSSENYVMNSSILIWIFYGFASKYENFKNGKEKDNENIANQ